jgi:LCP family protein required for cell wall assembly
MKKEDKDIEIHFENGHVPRRQNQNSNISHTAARGMRGKKKSKDAKEPGKLKRKWKNLKKWQRVVIIVVAVILLLAAVSCALVFGMWGGFKKNVDKDNLGVSDDIANKYGKTDIVNIALFGVDTRDKDSFSGRSDSIMIVSIDKAKNDIKLISVLRDSCVAIDGHGNQKITHAYAYGGAELAIKTLNQNFNMNITDYATINFYKLAEAIDILGGVDIDITEDERLELNNICRSFLYKYGTDFYGCSVLAGKWMFPEKIVESGKFRVIKNAIDLTNFVYSPEKREKMRTELNLGDKFVIGNVGNFLYQKNHDFMVRVFSELCKIDDNAHLLLVGDGLLFENVKEQVRSLGLTDKVTFTGRQTNAYDYMMAMDIYLMPSHFEGFGIAAIEAEATGLMCYLSDHIPSDAVITENCITLSIDRDEDAKIWAEKIEKAKGYKRFDRSDEIRKEGYDLSAQNFNELV